MAAKHQTPVTDLTVDLASMTVAPESEPPTQNNLAELQRLLQGFVQQGALQQRPDGSLVLPGFADPRQAQIDTQGSDCACDRCTPYNQYHWFCAGCYSGPHEWAIRQPKGDPITILGPKSPSGGAMPGKSYQFCTPDCGRVYRQRHGGLTPGVAPAAGFLDGIPIAG